MSPRTLILTPWMSPHKIVSWQTAVTMLYLAKAERIADYATEIRSPSTMILMPAVVRLLKPVNHTKRGIKFSRLNVLTRDNWRCSYCDARGTLGTLTYDHVVPRSRGGATRWENVTSSCKPCNQRKGNRTPAEAGMTLKRPPFRPKALPMGPLHIHPREIISEWQDYVGIAVA